MYSHDGLKDSLTNLAAPPLFYEELRRGIVRVARSGETFVLIRFVLANVIVGEMGDVSESKYPDDAEIIKFADALMRASRGDDLCARMGEHEFVVLLYACESMVETYIERIGRACKSMVYPPFQVEDSPKVWLKTSFISHQPGQSALECLEDLDRQPLITCSR